MISIRALTVLLIAVAAAGCGINAVERGQPVAPAEPGVVLPGRE